MADFGPVQMVEQVTPLAHLADDQREAAVTALCSAAVRLRAPVGDVLTVLEAAGLS